MRFSDTIAGARNLSLGAGLLREEYWYKDRSSVLMVGANPSISGTTRGVIFSPLVDLLILGGVSILCFGLCQAIDFVTPYFKLNNLGIQIVFFLSLLINQPHYSATYYRVYRSWAETKRYAVVAIWLPLLLAGTAVASFLAPDTVAGWFCKAYFLTVSYHYAGQTYGIALIFAHKAGITVNRLVKVSLGLPVYSSAALYLVGDEVITGRRYFMNVQLPIIGFPLWMYLLALFFLVLGVGAYIAMSFYLASQNKKLPLIAHIVVLTQLLWFTLGMRLELFTALVPMFHCLQYLLITTYFRFQELVKAGQMPAMPGLSFFKSGQFWRYYTMLIVLGLLFFNGVPNLLTFLKAGSADFAYAVVYSFVNLHHFLLDGEIWKLRKPDIGKALLT